MKFILVFLFLLGDFGVLTRGEYIMGQTGQDCYSACLNVGKNCNARIFTNNSTSIFTQLGVKCTQAPNKPWWASDQPSYEPSTGSCLGFIDVPDAVACQGSFPTTQRICNCVDSTDSPAPFGTGYSQGFLNTQERTIFAWVLPNNSAAVMNHFWITPSSEHALIKYYVDGEDTASIAFQPALAAGVGFNDQKTVYGTKWFGHGAHTGAFFWNFKVGGGSVHCSVLLIFFFLRFLLERV